MGTRPTLMPIWSVTRGSRPVLRGIEGLWLLDEGAGVTAADTGGGGNDMTLGADAYTPTWAATGILGAANKFISSLGWVPTLSAGYTFTAAVQDTGSGASYNGLLKTCDGANRAGIWGQVNDTGIEVYWLRTGDYQWSTAHNRKGSGDAMSQQGGGGMGVQDGLWHTITLVNNGTSSVFYRDGTISTDGLETIDAYDQTVANTAIGIGNSSNCWTGNIGMVKFNNVVLTDAELTQDWAYFTAVMGGRGVTLPFEPKAVADTVVACIYDEGIIPLGTGNPNIRRWNGGVKDLDYKGNVLPAYLVPRADGSETFDGFVFGGFSGLWTDSMTMAQPFTVYALVSSQVGVLNSIAYAPIAFYDDASDDVEFYIQSPAGTGKVGAISGGNTGSPDSQIEGAVYSPRDWQRVRAVFDGADSLVQMEGTTSTGTLDNNPIAGSILTCYADLCYAHWQLIDGRVSSADHDQMWNYLGDIKDLLPTYSGVVVVTNDDAYRAFPGVTVDTSLTPDNILGVFRHGADHATTLDGVIKLVKSTDDGATWSAEATIHTPAANHDARDPRITVLSTNRWIVSWFDWDGADARIVKTMYSDNQGGAWSSPVTFSSTTSMAWLACSGYVTELASGDLMMPTYGEPSGGGDQICLVFRSDDGGDTWVEDSTLTISGQDANEPNLLLLADATLLMFIRSETNSWTYRSACANSAADPLVWGAAAQAVKGRAAPGVCVLSDDTLVLCTRNTVDYYDATGTYPMCIYTSDDDGVTWSDPIHPEPTMRTQEYGTPIEYDPGTGAKPYLFWSQEGVGATLLWRDLSDVIS